MRLGVSAALIGERLVAGDLEVEDGRVAEFGVGRSQGAAIAIPGFVDVHFHGRDGIDFTAATLYDHLRISKNVTRTGVTAYQPTVMSAGLEKMKKAIAQHPGVVAGGARVLGFHLEGPFLSPRHNGAHSRADLLPASIEIAHELLTQGPVAQMTIAPEVRGSMEVIEYLVENGVLVSLGHSGADTAVVEAARAAGATAYTHVFNAMAPMHHRSPGMAGYALTDREAYLTAVFDGAHLARETELLVVRAAGHNLIAITDGSPAVGQDEGEILLGGKAATVRDGAPRLANGTIAGSVLTMDAAFRNLLGLGLSLADAARATSGNPARFAGLANSGSLVPGNQADIAIIDDNLEITRTLVGGEEVFSA